MSVTSEEINYLIFRYLQESGIRSTTHRLYRQDGRVSKEWHKQETLGLTFIPFPFHYRLCPHWIRIPK